MRSATKGELEEAIARPRDFANDPNMLFVSYVLDTLKGMLIDYDKFYDDEDEQQEIWGAEFDKKTFDRMLGEMADEFCTCAETRQQLRIGGSGFTLRNASGVSRRGLKTLFDFRVNDKNYIIEPEGVLVDDGIDDFAQRKAELASDKLMMKKIVFLAEHEDGWDRLTDIEAAAYCWYINQKKKNPKPVNEWADAYISYHGLGLDEIRKAWRNGEPKGMFPFSQRLVEDFNKSHRQKSSLHNVPDENAEDYWDSGNK